MPAQSGVQGERGDHRIVAGRSERDGAAGADTAERCGLFFPTAAVAHCVLSLCALVSLGLNYILTTQGKKVVDEKATTAQIEQESKRKASVADAPASPAKNAAAAVAPSSPTATTRSTASTSPSAAKATAVAAIEEEEEPSGAEALEVIQRGGAFTLYSASEPPQKISLWHEESPEDKLGILYYDRLGARNKKPSQSLRCSRLSDILLGKQTPILSALKQLREDDCLTMVTPTLSWNLSCPEKQLNVWIIGINHLLASGGQTVVMEEEGVETAITPAPASPSSSSSAAPAAAPTTVPAAAATPAAAPAATDADAPAAVPHRRMSYKPDTTRALIPESVPDSASPNTQRASLIKAGGAAGPGGANLLTGFAPVAEESEGEEDEDEDEESEKDEDDDEKKGDSDADSAEPNFTAAEEDDAPAAVTEQAPGLDLEPNSVIAQMERGSTFLLHTLMAPPALTHVWLASTDGTLGSLNWCPLQNKPERAGWTQPESAPNRVPVAALSDVYLGRAQFPSAALDATKDDCCLSLVFTSGGGRKLHLESSNGAEGRNSFLLGLNHVLTSSGTAVVMEEKQTAEAAAAAAAAEQEQEVVQPSAPSVEPVAPLRQKRFSVIQNAASISMAKAAIEIPTEPAVPLVPAAFGLQAGLGDLMSMLRRGRTFQHHSNTTGNAEVNEILLWYRSPEEEPQMALNSKKKSAGSLCWNARGIKEVVGEQVLPLKKISDIFLFVHTHTIRWLTLL